VVFFPETAEALESLTEHFQLFIVTHQPGVAKGVISLDNVMKVNTHIMTILAEAGIRIVDVYCCPHSPSEDCPCIKPKPYFLWKAARDYSVDLHRSFVIGDHPNDVELARNAGAWGIYVLTGHGAKHREELSTETVVVPGILEAAKWILDHHQ
jgi:D-glycero-D-manno-heptose 1,7-bisphosphate phosphatase